MAGDPHREVACVAAAFRPPFPLLVGQPFLAVLRFIFSTALVAAAFSPAFPRLWHSHSWLCSDLHLLDWAKKRKMKWVASQHPEADAMSCVVRISRESASFAGRSRVFESLLARQNYP